MDKCIFLTRIKIPSLKEQVLHFTQDTELVFIVWSFSFFLFFFSFPFLEPGFHCVAQVGLKLLILPTQPHVLLLQVYSPASYTEFLEKMFPTKSTLSHFLVKSTQHLKIIPILHKFLELRKRPILSYMLYEASVKPRAKPEAIIKRL